MKKPSHLIESFEKSLSPNAFRNVRSVVILHSDLGNQLASLSQWFPNLNSLALSSVRMDDRYIDAPFENLINLEIDVNNGIRHDAFTKSEAMQLLRLCPILMMLKIHTPGRQGMTMKTLLNVIAANPLITILSLSMDKYSVIVHPTEVQRIVNEHPTLIKLDVKNFKFAPDTAIALVRGLHSLQKFDFQIEANHPHLRREYHQFVTQLDQQWMAYLDDLAFDRQIVSITQ